MKFPDDVKNIVMRKFIRHRKEWLKTSVIETNDSWPLIINLEIPTEQQVLKQQEDVRKWITSWKEWENRSNKINNTLSYGSLVWIERNWRTFGTQSVPEKFVINQPEQAVSLLDKTDEWTKAVMRFKMMIQNWQKLINTLPKYYNFLINSDDTDFIFLIDMLKWLCKNPNSNLYPRQIPVEGIDSKWLETHKGLVTELFSAIQDATGTDFYETCGLKPLPQLIRIRILDPDLRSQLGGLCDISVPVEEAANLAIKPANVFIVENLQTGLAFQDLPNSVVIMGLGYGVDVLENISWLANARCIYWGDIDTHGFAILNRARKYLPSLESIFMDEETLLNHRPLWVKEEKRRSLTELPLLTDSEQKLFQSLKDNVWEENVRLEQERICWNTAWEKMKEIVEKRRSSPNSLYL